MDQISAETAHLMALRAGEGLGVPQDWQAALDLLRRNKPEAEMSPETPEPRDLSPNPERMLINDARREQVRQAIARLAPEFREALVLREIEELSYKEIGAVLNIPIGTVMSRLSRARNLLLVELTAAKEVGGR